MAEVDESRNRGKNRGESAIHLNQQQLDTLAAMGVQVWFARGIEQAPTADQERSEPLPVPQPEPVPVPQLEPAKVARDAAPVNTRASEPKLADDDPAQQLPVNTSASEPVAPLHFNWFKTESALLMLHEADDPALARLLGDVMIYVDWRTRQSTADSGGTQLQQGQFRWPQLQQTLGTPARALAVWLDKHGAEKLAWLGASSLLIQQLSPWIEPLDIRLTDVGDPQQAVRDAAAKKELWRLLNNSL